MKKLLVVASVSAALCAPAAASAEKPSKSDKQQARETCKQLRAESGKRNFASMFGGGKKGLGRCIKRESRENAAERVAAAETSRKNAAQECRELREADREGFRETFGTNRNGKNAFGKCVSQMAQENREEDAEEDAEEDENQVNAASECRDERRTDPDAFRDKYGTNANKRNAFGKCVSQKAQDRNDDEPEPETTA